MPLILQIDTATSNAIISISQNEDILRSLTNNNQKEHASFLQSGIKEILHKSNIDIRQLSAVSVTAGPGSYTGLRVAMASAKGICYALQIPLITLNTLEVMALSVIQQTNEPGLYFYCPMIDAGRMEVFTALFDENLIEIMPPCALILQQESFDEFMQKKPIIFCGNGAEKFINISNKSDLLYMDVPDKASALTSLSLQKFKQNIFADLIKSEPLYLKQFYSGSAG